MNERWQSRLRTAEAMIALGVARLLIATIPFRHWRRTLGGTDTGQASEIFTAHAKRLADHVDWAARLLPLSTKCLPRAMALSWMLRSRRIDHCVILAVRPAGHRGSDDQLHAWVEISETKLIGDLPGPWIETLRLGHEQCAGT